MTSVWTRPGARMVGGLLAAAAFLLFGGLPCCRAAAPAAADLRTAPVQDGNPVKVAVSLHIINIASINEVTEQFEIDGYLMARWTDPRLAFTPTQPTDQHRQYARAQVWIPSFEMVNAVAPRQRDNTSAQGDPDGSVSYVERFHAVLSSKFMLRRFPFDSQSLLIVVHPYLRQERQVEFTAYNREVWATREFTQYSSLAQWNLKRVELWIGTSELYGGRRISEARFTINVERRYAFYLWKVFLPLLLMVVLSWAVFWIEARDLSNQVQIAITTILTVIAFAFAISATMPRVPYLTYIDAFFLTCYVFVFVAIVELMAVHLSHRREKSSDLGVRIQRISRWAVPLAFLVTNLILIGHFLK
jgi:Neurotransmitter-gated ion-channel ligand binding domain/Neurotransmitter-gated ion-channel transmembrane region